MPTVVLVPFLATACSVAALGVWFALVEKVLETAGELAVSVDEQAWFLLRTLVRLRVIIWPIGTVVLFSCL